MKKDLMKKRPIRDVLREMNIGGVERFPITQKNSIRNSIPDIKLEHKLNGVDAKFKGNRELDSTIWKVERIS